MIGDMTETFALGGDLTINRPGFGAMRLAAGTFDGPARAPETGIAVLRRALDLGVNHIDTAAFYARGAVRANHLIRTALSPYPDDLVIATKVGPIVNADGIPALEATPQQLRGLVEDNLKVLGLDRLDLVYLRVGGITGPGGASIGSRFAVLAELRAEGLIRHLGVSNVDLAQLAEARAIAPVAAVQNRFGVHDRASMELLAECADNGIGFVPFFSLVGEPSHGLRTVAARHGASVQQIALAWTLAISPAVLAIPGTGDRTHLEQNMSAARIELTDEDLAAL
jgi:aryl-alcohol dehydrogenase-like predicted oxidoreductase